MSGVRRRWRCQAQPADKGRHDERSAVRGLGRDVGVDLDAGQGRDPPRDVGVRRWRTDGRNAELLYDNLDFMHGVEAFINSFPGASLAAMRRGFLGIGVEDNDVLAFPELMDSASLFLTANCDTLYFISFLDLTNGPMVVELPALGPPTESWVGSTTCGSTG